MTMEYCYAHDEILTYTLAGYEFITTSDDDDQINFIFSCKQQFSEWVKGQDSTPPQLVGYLDQPLVNVLVRVSRQQFFNFECEAIEQVLKNLLEWDDIQDMIDRTWITAREIVQSNRSIQKNYVNLHFDILLERRDFIWSVDYENMEKMSCSICLETFFDCQELLHTPCSHVFHCDCIEKWLSIGRNCPLCRYEMPNVFGRCTNLENLV